LRNITLNKWPTPPTSLHLLAKLIFNKLYASNFLAEKSTTKSVKYESTNSLVELNRQKVNGTEYVIIGGVIRK
jgi:hypothetical protein